MTNYKKNKKLVEKYPWLVPNRIWKADDTYEIPEDYEYDYTLLDDFPVGWFRAFGMELVEEIDEELKRQGEKVRNSYCVYEIKEKYAELRWYDNGNETIRRIVNKYAIISHHTCMVCGKPDTPVRVDGWIWPECKECYEKDSYNHLPYEEVIQKDNPSVNPKNTDSTIPDSYTIYIHSSEGDYKETFDISETVKKIRKKMSHIFHS